jgi:hypothetical protein
MQGFAAGFQKSFTLLRRISRSVFFEVCNQMFFFATLTTRRRLNQRGATRHHFEIHGKPTSQLRMFRLFLRNCLCFVCSCIVSQQSRRHVPPLCYGERARIRWKHLNANMVGARGLMSANTIDNRS